MKKLRRLPPRLLLILLALPALAGATPTRPAVEQAVRHALDAWGVPGAALAIVHQGEVVYLQGHGIRDISRSEPVTADTLFPIASCTKGFTTTLMAMLVDEGKLHWDDPVRRHLPWFRLSDPLVDSAVTLRDLVSHRAGLRSHDFLWYRAPWSPEESVRRAGLLPVELRFRASFQYQSTMFTAAGLAAAAAAGQPWEQLVRRRLFEPLDMKTATVTTLPAEESPDHASGHRRRDDGQLDVVPWYRIDTPDPAGSICASARDMAQWAIFHLREGEYRGERLVSAKALGETKMPHNLVRLEGSARAMNPDTLQMSYGMAWVIHDHRGLLLHSHAGSIDGFRAHITLVPRERFGIVLLNNLQTTRMNLALSNTLIDLYFRLPAKDWNATFLEQVRREDADAEQRTRERLAKRHHGTKPSRELAAYVGRYLHPAYGIATVTLEKGALAWRCNAFGSRLEHFHYDTFLGHHDVLGGHQAIFTLGADGEVTSLRITDALDVEFVRARR